MPRGLLAKLESKHGWAVHEDRAHALGIVEDATPRRSLGPKPEKWRWVETYTGGVSYEN